MERDDPRYTEAVRFLFDRINYEKSSDRPYNQQTFRLGRMQFLLEKLGNPHLVAPVIHIAGTKGKGSVAWLVAETLRRSGKKTGLYTSPHLVHLEERFVVDGQSVSPSLFVEQIEGLRHAASLCNASEHGAPTFFELTTALAWSLFRAQATDVNIIEVGLGGRLDSTNVCEPSLCVITSISYDHQQQLGNTLALIAGEKAGILKPRVPAIHGARAEEARNVIWSRALELECDLWELGRDFECVSVDEPAASASTCRETLVNKADMQPTIARPNTLQYVVRNPRVPNVDLGSFPMRMRGKHQADNAALAIAVWSRLNEQGWQLPPEALRSAIAETQIPARIEIKSESPLVIVDAAHNIASIEALIQTLQESFAPTRRTVLFACSKDKQVTELLDRVLAFADRVILTQFQNNPRTVLVERLEEMARESQVLLNRQVDLLTSPDVKTALQFARRDAVEGELICVTGSFFIAAEALPLLDEE